MKKIGDEYIKKDIFKLNKQFIFPIFIFIILGSIVLLFGVFSDIFPDDLYSFDIEEYRFITRILSIVIFLFFSVLIPNRIYKTLVSINEKSDDWNIVEDIVEEKNFIVNDTDTIGDTIYYLKFKNTETVALVDYSHYLKVNMGDKYYLVMSKEKTHFNIPNQSKYNYYITKSQEVYRIYSVEKYQYIGKKGNDINDWFNRWYDNKKWKNKIY